MKPSGPYKRFGHRSHTRWSRMAGSKTQDVLDRQVKQLQYQISKGKEVIQLLVELKNFEAARLDIEELISLAAFGRGLKAEFAFQSVDVPEWVNDRLKELGREINARTQDALEAKLKKAKALRETLKPAEEKRGELDKQIAELEAKLGVTV